MALLEAKSVDKNYVAGTTHLTVLRGLDLVVDKGEMVAIVGASGVGKSTLLHVLGGLDALDAGSVRIGDQDLGAMKPDALTAFRNHHVGFVFQFHHLLPEFTALENAGMPMRIARMPGDERDGRARALLERVGLAGRRRRSASRARARCWRGSASPSAPPTIPACCPAESSSGWPSRARW